MAVYAVRANGGNNQQEVMTLNKEREKILRDTYWDMNEITWNKSLDKEKLLKLTINIRGKSVQEIANQYKFNDQQKKMLDELLNGKYDDQWKNALVSTDIVKVAESQLGNKGRRALLELVWFSIKSRMVCLFCILVCKSMWLYRCRNCSKIFWLSIWWSYLV